MKLIKNRNYLIQADCFKLLGALPAKSIQLIYIDPPFNTGKVLQRDTFEMVESITGTRMGFGGKRYDAKKVKTTHYSDQNENYLPWLFDVIQACRRVLKHNGSLLLHLDQREVHRAKIFCDLIFGEQNFKNEIIWAFDYGGKPKNRWPVKHNTILWYTKDPKVYIFNYEAIDRVPYMAPLLVGPVKAEKGKIPTACFWGSIVGTNSSEKTGWPTQKPLWLLRRLVAVHSEPGGRVLDCFAGSGSLGEAAGGLQRPFVLGDANPEAIKVCQKRLATFNPALISTAL